MAKRYLDICIQPIPKNKLAEYRKTTTQIGKLLVKYGALSSRDYVAEDANATKHSFPKKIKMRKGEVLIFAEAEFKSKSHREQVFKKMSKDPLMEKMSEGGMMDQSRAVIGGFEILVAVEK